MRYFQHVIIAALLMQFFVSCLARKRFIPDPWPASSSYWGELEDSSSTESSGSSDSDLAEGASLLTMKAKKAARRSYPLDNEERRKKYLGESGFHNGHSLQGLWAMPGRR